VGTCQQMTSTQYRQDSAFGELYLSEIELRAVKQLLKNSCYFILSRDTQYGASKRNCQVRVRWHVRDNFLHYHVTNDGRRQLLKAFDSDFK
jgi:hypothetical protein